MVLSCTTLNRYKTDRYRSSPYGGSNSKVYFPKLALPKYQARRTGLHPMLQLQCSHAVMSLLITSPCTTPYGRVLVVCYNKCTRLCSLPPHSRSVFYSHGARSSLRSHPRSTCAPHVPHRDRSPGVTLCARVLPACACTPGVRSCLSFTLHSPPPTLLSPLLPLLPPHQPQAPTHLLMTPPAHADSP